MTTADRITYQTTFRDGCLIVRPIGVLTAATYSGLRDTLVKLAMEQPRAVIADVDDLWISSEPALTVFSAAWMRVGDWPGVPILLVAEDTTQRALLRASSIRRFVPVFDDVDTAVSAADLPPMRRRTRLELPPVTASSRHARQFVGDTCGRWQVAEVAQDAKDVASELVENAVRHAGSEMSLRLDLRSGLLSVAVSDKSPREAVLREADVDPHHGLRLVAALARVWGCTPESSGGKVVWAVLATADRPFQALRP